MPIVRSILATLIIAWAILAGTSLSSAIGGVAPDSVCDTVRSTAGMIEVTQLVHQLEDARASEDSETYYILAYGLYTFFGDSLIHPILYEAGDEWVVVGYNEDGYFTVVAGTNWSVTPEYGFSYPDCAFISPTFSDKGYKVLDWEDFWQSQDLSKDL